MSKQFGLIGKTLAHSFSKDYFTKKFKLHGIEAEYLNFELKTIKEVQQLKGENVSGFNVTIPYKEAIIPYLDEISDEAKPIGAVNTIEVKQGKWIGHNTDAFGFKQMVAPFLNNTHQKVLVFGTGGAAKAVTYFFENLGLEVNFISREKSGENCWSYEDINENMIKFHGVLVNTTPVGMFPEISNKLNIPYAAITPEHLVIDLIYNPSQTEFLRLAKEQGATTLNGQTMLEQQAEKSWLIWNS